MSDNEGSSRASKSYSAPEEREPASARRRGRSLWRWFLVVVGLVLLGFMMREVLFPFRDQAYMEIGHGNHTHYVPKDRNETVPVSAFPMRPPGSGEQITPDGDIVSR